MKRSHPPRLGEKIVGLLLSEADREALLGDFAETYERLAQELGVPRARRWYWRELLKSTPALLFLSKSHLKRSLAMEAKLENRLFSQYHQRWAVVGMILCLPAFLLVTSGLLQSGLGITADSILNFEWPIFYPAVISGGLLVGLLVNILAVTHLKLQWQADGLVSTLKVKRHLPSLGLVALVVGLGSIIFVYLLAENLQIFQMIGG